MQEPTQNTKKLWFQRGEKQRLNLGLEWASLCEVCCSTSERGEWIELRNECLFGKLERLKKIRTVGCFLIWVCGSPRWYHHFDGGYSWIWEWPFWVHSCDDDYALLVSNVKRVEYCWVPYNSSWTFNWVKV